MLTSIQYTQNKHSKTSQAHLHHLLPAASPESVGILLEAYSVDGANFQQFWFLPLFSGHRTKMEKKHSQLKTCFKEKPWFTTIYDNLIIKNSYTYIPPGELVLKKKNLKPVSQKKQESSLLVILPRDQLTILPLHIKTLSVVQGMLIKLTINSAVSKFSKVLSN